MQAHTSMDDMDAATTGYRLRTMSINATRDDNPTDSVAPIDEFDNIDCDDDTGRFIESLCTTIDGLCDTIDGLQDRLSNCEDENEQLHERIDELEQETEINESRLNALSDASIDTDETIDEQKDQLDAIEDDQDILDNRITAIADGLERLEANDGDTNPGGDGEETTIEYAERKTPIERLLDDPQESGIRITPSVDRALKIASHIEEWSERAPVGRVIKDGLKRLLSTVEEETLAWRQIYRACRKLDDLTNGRIAFEKTDQHGRVLVMRDEKYMSRVVSAGGGEG